jgi:hypothetical protein
MPIDYTGTNAGLFVRLGKIINVGVEERSAQSTLVTHIEEVVGKYTSTSIDRTEYLGTMAGDKETIADAAGRSAQSAVRDALERTIIEQVDAEAPTRLVAPTLPNALRTLAIDMRANAQSIGTTNLSIGSLSVTAAETTPAAQGALLMSTAPRYSYGGAKSSTKPAATDSILAEIVTARCTKDARDGSLIRGNERFEVVGEDAVDRLDRRWPRGSGAVLAINSTCGTVESSRVQGQNMLSNSGFERINATPFPLDWTVQTGTEGTNIVADTKPYRGAQAIKFTGTGSLLHNVYQVMGQAPRPTVKSNTVYFFSARYRAGSGTISGSPNATLSLELRDGSNAQISGCSVSTTLNGTTTTYALLEGSFTTPLAMPSTVRAVITFSVALGNTQELLVDELVLCEAAYLYTGGPGCCIIAGSSDHELDDRMSRTITKTAAQWQQELDRYLNLAALDVQFPTSTSPTITTTLIA